MPPAAPLHVPVLAAEVIEWLRPGPGGLFVDGTLGGGGHTALLAEAVGAEGHVIALDRDPAAVDAATTRFTSPPVLAVHANYADLPEVLEQHGISAVDGILLDLGLSSDQLADESRGFSFRSSGPLDLRYDPTRGEPAWKLIERLSSQHLADLIYRYGEERFSRRIARAIVAVREQKPIRTAADLTAVLHRCIRPRRDDRIDPATRTFQALRIAVNDELKALEIALRRLPAMLRPGGRMAVISFHSLEDRLVKEAFRGDDSLIVLTRRPVRAGPAEVDGNPRARSAKLRVAERKDG